MSFPEMSRPISFQQMRAELGDVCALAGIRLFTLKISPEVTREHEVDRRRYAQVELASPPVFEFADQARKLPYSQRLGLYAHEVGHVLAWGTVGDHDEDTADAFGMAALDLIIVYDKRWPGKGLQTAMR